MYPCPAVPETGNSPEFASDPKTINDAPVPPSLPV